MKTKTVKTHIKRLLQEHGSRDKVATVLGITPRYVRNLENGEKIPSDHLRKLIKMMM